MSQTGEKKTQTSKKSHKLVKKVTNQQKKSKTNEKSHKLVKNFTN